MITLDTSDARKNFKDVLQAVKKGEQVLLKRHGKSVAAIVSVRDLAFLRELEDRIDREDADAALKKIDEGTVVPVPWEDVKARLGL